MSNIASIARDALMMPGSGVFSEGSTKVIKGVTVLGEKCDKNIGKAVVCIGVFDGVHAGHRFLIEKMIEDARSKGVPSVVVTFDPDPDELFRPPREQRKILSNEDRINALAHLGADYVYVIPFSLEIANLHHEAFFNGILGPFCKPIAVHVGADFKLGHNGGGTMEVLRVWGGENDCVFNGYDLVVEDGGVISATRIRNLIQNNDISEAVRLLRRRHYLKGIVVPGRQMGTGLGFPTANIETVCNYIVVPEGVYAGMVIVRDVVYPAAISVGKAPTFDKSLNRADIEAMLLGFSGDLYGQEVSVVFTEQLRGMKKFDSIAELVSAVLSNIDEVGDMYGKDPMEV